MLLGIDFTGSRGHLCGVVILFLSYTGGRLWGGGPLSGESQNSAVSSSEYTVDPIRPSPCYPFSARADTPQPLMDLSGCKPMAVWGSLSKNRLLPLFVGNGPLDRPIFPKCLLSMTLFSLHIRIIIPIVQKRKTSLGEGDEVSDATWPHMGETVN